MVVTLALAVLCGSSASSGNRLVGIWEATDGTGERALHSRVRYTSDRRFQLYAVGYPTPGTGWNTLGTYTLKAGKLHLAIKRVTVVGVGSDRRAYANQVLARKFGKPEDDNFHWLDSNHFEFLYTKGRTKPLVYSRVE